MGALLETSVLIGAFKSFILSLSAYAMLFAGLAFLNMRFMPAVFGGFYEQSNMPVRLAVFLVIVALPSNYILAKALDVTLASIAGPAMIVAFVLTSVINALLLDKLSMSWPIAGALVLAIFSCGILSWLLAAQKLS